jgi:excisionase family DNA binding protein
MERRCAVAAIPAVERGPVAATEHERDLLAEVERLLEREPGGRLRLLGAGGKELELPESLVRLLRQAVHAMARDRAVTVVPVHKQLTTQQAADLLNVSRPYLVHLLDAGAIPSTKTGTHRRVRLEDVLAYRERRDEQRQADLDLLTQLGQDMGLYRRG